MRPNWDERMWLFLLIVYVVPVSRDTGDDKDISYQSYRRQKILYQLLPSPLLYYKIQSW